MSFSLHIFQQALQVLRREVVHRVTELARQLAAALFRQHLLQLVMLKPTGGGKLSKRDGDKMGFPVFPLQWTSPEGETSHGYREDGYFPEAFVNMLALLGWNPGTDQEIFSMDELIGAFSLERVSKSGARFNPEKARWFNAQYLHAKSDAELAGILMPVLKEKGIEAGKDRAEKAVALIKERATFPQELWNLSQIAINAIIRLSLTFQPCFCVII